MNKEETRALWGKGSEAWNAWALTMLQRKEALETGGNWSVDWFGEGQNPQTAAWLAEAQADFEAIEFASDASFENFVFPGSAVFDAAHFLGRASFTGVHFAHTARFQAARFDGEANWKQVQFYQMANFDDATFASAADFERAEFQRETTGPLVPSVRFHKTQFCSRADFRSVTFTGNAEFIRTVFKGNARFDEAVFHADGVFDNAVFESTVGLVKTRFIGAAKFAQAQFQSEARLSEVEFQGGAGFEEAAFAGKATFRTAKFGGDTSFQEARFRQDARFSESHFTGPVIFRHARFDASAEFQSVSFAGPVDFLGCVFAGDTSFENAVFSATADFPYAKFKDRGSFSDVRFLDRANFLQSQFRSRASFRNGRFRGPAEFAAVQSRAAFALAGAHFDQVPSFHDASFRDPPRLDNMTIDDPLAVLPAWSGKAEADPRPALFRGIKACGDPEYAGYYRRLRKLAAETQDYEREREFYAQELRCRRFWHDKPFGDGLARFWIGWLYGGVSDFGRSLVRPVVLWVASILVFTLVYLSQRQASYFATAPGPVASGAPIFPVWPAHPSVASLFSWAGSTLQWLFLSVFNLFAGGGCIAGDSGATGEALFLSLKNSLFFLGWESPEAAHRVYGCLYGFDASAGGATVNVPLSVSTVAIIENMFGAMLIVLFLLAVRNLLRAR
jgi:Pentapeptide repeats (9 copies)